jgi:hypothetical protein
VGRRLDESRFTKTDAHTVAQDDAPPRQFPPEWGPGCEGDLIVTLDDATNENYSAFFSRERGGTACAVDRDAPRRDPVCARRARYWMLVIKESLKFF